MDAALAIATQFEHLHSRNPVDVNTMSVRPRLNNANTHRFPIHNVTSNGRLSHSSNVQLPQIVCSYFHKKGHVINDCYSRQNKSNNNPKGSTNNPSTRHTKPFHQRSSTTGCNQRTYQINSLHTASSDQLLRVHGSVASVTNLLCTLDSASSVSMMTRDVANRYNFTILPSDIQIKSANNAVTAVVGVTEILTIDINGHTCQISFIVLEHDDHETFFL